MPEDYYRWGIAPSSTKFLLLLFHGVLLFSKFIDCYLP